VEGGTGEGERKKDKQKRDFYSSNCFKVTILRDKILATKAGG
jgi:hypothetical protein